MRLLMIRHATAVPRGAPDMPDDDAEAREEDHEVVELVAPDVGLAVKGLAMEIRKLHHVVVA